MWGLISRPWDHDLSQRQMLNQLSHPGAPILFHLNPYSKSGCSGLQTLWSGSNRQNIKQPFSHWLQAVPLLCVLSLGDWEVPKDEEVRLYSQMRLRQMHRILNGLAFLGMSVLKLPAAYVTCPHSVQQPLSPSSTGHRPGGSPAL